MGLSGVDWADLFAGLSFAVSLVALLIASLPKLIEWWNRRKGKVLFAVDFVDGTASTRARGVGPLSLPLRIQNRSGFDVAIHRVVVRSVDSKIQFQTATLAQQLSGVKFVDSAYQGFWLEVTIPEQFRGVDPLEVGANGNALTSGRHLIEVEILTTPTNRLPPFRLWVDVPTEPGFR
ncbi:MAG: hypothetical protein L3K18_04435 [Thermoplasmata archaeon]|nr:hypothetical protein [Thermoplasmata archaeon]